MENEILEKGSSLHIKEIAILKRKQHEYSLRLSETQSVRNSLIPVFLSNVLEVVCRVIHYPILRKIGSIKNAFRYLHAKVPSSYRNIIYGIIIATGKECFK